jgi:DNA-binding CsgD family transcriptional regulator
LVACLASAVFLFDQKANTVGVLAAEVDQPLRTKNLPHLDLTQLLWEHELLCVLQRGQVFLVSDLRVHSPVFHSLGELLGWGLRALLAVPLLIQGDLIGLLWLGSGRPGAFAPEHVELTCQVARSLAIAIYQARLLEQAQAGRDPFRQLAWQAEATAEKENRAHNLAKRLTSRERQVLQLVFEGHTNRSIGQVLQISIKTVEKHRANLMRKLDTRSLAKLIRVAIQHELVVPTP